MKHLNKLTMLLMALTMSTSLMAQGGSTCAHFDGTNDYLSLGGNYYQYNAFTTELWVYATDWTPSSDQIIITTNTDGGGEGWKIELQPSSVRFYLVADNTKNITVSTSSLETGWHHIAATYDGANMNLWVDGNLNATTAQTGNVVYPSSQTTLIGTHSDLTEDFNGYMDEIRFWNVALSQSQIQEWMNQPIISGHAPANVSNLRGYYKLDTDWPTSPNELDDCANDVGGGASDRDLTNNSCTFIDKKTPIGDFPTGYTTDTEALWRAFGTGWSDESTGLALQDWDAQSIDADEFYAFANNGLTGTSTSDLPTDVDIRASTIWFLDDVANDRSNWNFDLSEFGASAIEVSGLDAANYKLLRRTGTSGDFSVVETGNTISGGEVYFEDYTPSGDAYYTIGRDNDLATVTTTAASSIGFMDATSGGEVTDNGGGTVSEQGICYSKTSPPTTSDIKKKDYSGQNPFTKIIYDLVPNTTYYIRAYAINSEGTAYGGVQSFTTTSATNWTPSGTGTSESPYQIANLNNLVWMMETESSWDSYFELTADIDASATSAWDGNKGFAPIGRETPTEDQFNGYLEGNGYVISNLYVNRPNTNDVGLFGYTDRNYSKAETSYVQNLGMEDVNFTGGYRTAGLIGRSTSLVSNCYVTGSVTGDPSNSIAAGLIGQSHKLVKNSYSTASVSAKYEAAGFISFNNSDIENCYSTGAVTDATENLDGFCNDANGHGGGTISNSFWDTQTSGQSSSSGGTGKTTSDMKNVATFTDETTVGLTTAWDFIGNPNNDVENNDYWSIDGTTNNGYPFLSWEAQCWDGGNSKTSDWFIGSNWQSGAVPTSTDDVSISNTTTMPVISGSTTAECNNLVVALGSSLTIEDDGKLTASGDVTNSGTITVESTSSGTGSLIVNGTATGDVTVERFLTHGKWHYIAEPINTSGNFST
ncbi:MAG: hypothetical protein K8R37_01145, partial [Bacteroidales bacterium]|nr:hypothetical protein [Bacteroidales bacterium]